jgi:hypothetical protein
MGVGTVPHGHNLGYFYLLGCVRLEGQPFKLEVEKIVHNLLGKGFDVLCSYPLVLETTFQYSEARILCF